MPAKCSGLKVASSYLIAITVFCLGLTFVSGGFSSDVNVCRVEVVPLLEVIWPLKILYFSRYYFGLRLVNDRALWLIVVLD